MADHGSAVNGGVQSGVDSVGLGSQTDGDIVGFAGNGAVIEILKAERIGEETLHILAQHVEVGVEVQGDDTAGGHQQVLGAMHQLEAYFIIGAGLDGGDQHVIGLRPGAVLNFDVISQIGQVQVVHLQSAVTLAAILCVVVAGVGHPHIQEADGIVVVGQPAVAGDGVVAVLTGIQEGVPLLVFQVHGDADAGQSGLQVLTNGLVVFIGVIQIGQGGKVGELLCIFVPGVVLLQDLNGLSEVVLIGVFRHVVVAVIALITTGILVELGAIRFGHTHCHEGGGGDLTALGNVVDDVVAVEHQSDGVADFLAGRFFFFRSHAGGVQGALGIAGAAAAGDQRQSHDQCQEQSKKLFHGIFPFTQLYFQHVPRCTHAEAF